MGGWGAILVHAGSAREREISGTVEGATNQQMELEAAIQALTALTKPCRVTLVSDSAYMVNAFKQNWFAKWRRNGWRNSKKEPVANRDRWERLLGAASRHEVTWVHVRGHQGEVNNERADGLATGAIDAVA